jgi:hypothetical protein
VKTGNDQNPILLDFENYPIREAPNSGATPVAVDHRETLRVFLYRLDRGLDCKRKPLTETRRTFWYHARASLRSAPASGSQTTGNVTVF